MAINLEEFETSLVEERKRQKRDLIWFEIHGITHKTVLGIERGGNYRISSLFRYVRLLNCHVDINGITFNDYTDVGPYMKSMRELSHFNRVEMSKLCNVSMMSMNELEHGGDFTRNTLKKYGFRIGMNFTLRQPGTGIVLDSKLNYEEDNG